MMKTKIILSISVLLCLTALFSFKTSGGNGSDTILISLVNGRDEDNGFMVTYSDGKTEKIPFTFKLKPLDPGSWIEAQAQATIILNKMREKGYRVKASTILYGVQVMVLEKD